MIRVRTFTAPLTVYATARGLHELDRQVTAFLNGEGATQVLALSDATTTGEHGETTGPIRAVVYEVD